MRCCEARGHVIQEVLDGCCILLHPGGAGVRLRLLSRALLTLSCACLLWAESCRGETTPAPPHCSLYLQTQHQLGVWR